ncbi:hypothetical protein ALC60_14374 [Trachymyrmex zeteki]|uniref:Uncharacterized protein n=1 Tax=Mycetomoellerius zeteki TaxID=64791 RepID=A0A151WFQ5_9HYME|nr:hypothetical protein ALC60_14374 [Trachymyrmex zeteki]
MAIFSGLSRTGQNVSRDETGRDSETGGDRNRLNRTGRGKQETPRRGATTIDELTLLLAGNFTRSADRDVRTSQNVTTRRLAAHFACWQLLAAQFGIRSRCPVIVRVFARCHHR